MYEDKRDELIMLSKISNYESLQKRVSCRMIKGACSDLDRTKQVK